MLIIGLILIFSGIVLFEAPRLWKQKMWRELLAFFGLLAVGFIMSLTAILRIGLPNPTTAIEFIFGPISDVILSFLEQ